jgi:hypothetical protein
MKIHTSWIHAEFQGFKEIFDQLDGNGEKQLPHPMYGSHKAGISV